MQNLYRAFFNSKRGHTVLGRRLRPFSNWHVLQLRCAKSPLIGYDGEIDLGALTVAASVCVTSYPNYFQPLRWSEIIRHRRALRTARYSSIDAELQRWIIYLRDYGAGPEYFKSIGGKDSGKLCKCPAPLAKWAALKMRGFPEADAWNAPTGKSDWYKIALDEAEGADLRQLVNDAVMDAMEKSGWAAKLKEAEKP